MEPETEIASHPKTIRIFISSPGDVAAERDKAKQVIAQLQNWYGPAVNLLPVLWEEMPLEIDSSFQDGIDVILGDHGIDMAVFILWSRIGTPVTVGDKTYNSGTEREFDLMLHALEASGGERPDILFYRRNDDDGFKKKLTVQDDPAEIRQLLNQSELAQSFIQEHFWDEHGQNTRAYHSFHQPVEFAGRLKVHLQGLIDKRLEDSGLNREARWADVPYRGLEVFHQEHADIFFGREREIVELESRLRDREHEEQPCAFVAVIGASGSGKSSLVRAGLRANLTRFNLDESISEWRSMVMMPGQAGGNPVRHLLECLAQPGALPELSESGLRIEELAEGMAAAPGNTINLTIKPLLRGTGNSRPKLLVIIDQFEELFTDTQISPGDRDRFLLTLEALAQSGICWVVVTMRSDFFPVAQKNEIFLRLKGQSGDGGHFDLLAPGPEALRRIITEPARMAGIRFEKRTPELGGQSVVGKILEDAREQPDMLPLLSDLLLELYQLRSPEGVITFAAYESLGDEDKTGLEGALSKRAEKEFAKLTDEQRATCPDILHALVTVEADAAVRRRADLNALRDTPQRAALVDAFIEARLLTADGPTVSIAHEALLRKWDRISDWVRDNRQHLRIRSRVEQSMRRWSNKGNHNSLLLPEGLDLEEGISLLGDANHLLAGREYDGVRDYIERSRQHHEARARKARSRRRIVTFFLSVLTIAALAFSAVALWAVENALRSRDDSRKTEGLQALETARTYPNVYPDRIFYTAKAIGFSGFSGEDGVSPYRPRKFLAPAFWREASGLLRGATSADFPVLVPDQLDTQRKLLEKMPAYLPFWRSAPYGKPVVGLEVTATHLRAGYEDGKTHQWELGKDNSEPAFASGEVALSEESSGVQFDGTTVKLKAFGHNFDLTSHASSPTAWALSDDKRVLYIGMKDGLVIAWDLSGESVEKRNLHDYIRGGWLAFNKADQKLFGRSPGRSDQFAGLPAPLLALFDPAKKQSFRNSIGMEFQPIEPGTFRMGSDGEDASDDETPHEVTLTKRFWMGAFEVTQAEWQAVMGDNPSEFKDPLAPVETVDWNKVNDFCQKLTERERKAGAIPEGWSYHLPTEAQWEYACRAGTKTESFFGDDLRPDQANFDASAIGKTVAVGRYQLNTWGLYEMHGNVGEWCWDRYGNYPTKNVSDHSGPASGGDRVFRGGSWNSSAGHCRSANRYFITPDYAFALLGFRVALSSRPPGQAGSGEGVSEASEAAPGKPGD